MSKTYKLIFAAKYEFYILYLVFVKISAQQQDRTKEPCNIIVLEVIIFMRAKQIISYFEGFFEGVKTFLTPKLLNRASVYNLHNSWFSSLSSWTAEMNVLKPQSKYGLVVYSLYVRIPKQKVEGNNRRSRFRHCIKLIKCFD
jgi:hypothetical protein